MLTAYIKRGLAAGLVGGFAFGLFVALVANPLVGYAETFEAGHGHGAGAASTASLVAMAVANAISVGGGVATGLLLGAVVFGAAYYLLEPAIPGAGDTRSYLLAAAGFVTLSAAPWLALPPRPPGVEEALPADVRIAWYGGLMLAGAVACGLSGLAYVRVRDRTDRGWGRPAALAAAALPLAALPLVASLAPANPATGPVPEGFVLAFRWVVVFGQVTLWLALGAAHAWLVRRADDGTATELLDDARDADGEFPAPAD